MSSETRSTYSVFNEVIKSSYPTLASLLINIKFEDAEFELYCEKIRIALWQEKRFYFKLSDQQIVEVSKILSPIIKAIINDNSQTKSIILKNKSYFDLIITKHGLNDYVRELSQ